MSHNLQPRVDGLCSKLDISPPVLPTSPYNSDMHCLLPGSGKSVLIQCETRKDNICLERDRAEEA